MNWTPPEPRIGSKYRKGIYTKEIAGLVRADIKAAIKAGELPKGTRATVKTEYFAGGSSIDVVLRAIGNESLQTAEYKQWHLACEKAGWKMSDNDTRPKQYSENTRRTLKALEALLNAYHYDASDSSVDYFSVNFYGHVRIAYEAERAELEAARLNTTTIAEAAAKEATERAALEKAKWEKEEAEFQAYLATEEGKKLTTKIEAAVAAEAAPKELTSWEKRCSLLEVD